MSDTPIQGIMETTLDKIKAMVNADTIVGDKIELPGGVVAIPVSKVSYGLVSGGSDFPNKANQKIFGGGGGAGVSISPVCFLVVKDGEVKLMPVSKDSGAAEKAVALIPELFDKITTMFKNKKAEKLDDENKEALTEDLV
ncbi:MAG TPA: sporulation protein YtfJ [Ruminococcaceae bacterium]|nr:sporulation protein YtfJ [Oscillospiraceae bacterium]